MKKIFSLGYFIISISILLCFSCGKKNKPTITEVNLVQDFSKTSIYHSDVEKTRYSSDEPESKDLVALTKATLFVLESKDGYTTCLWEYGETSIKDFPMDSIAEEYRSVINLYKGMEVKFTVDSAGTIQELLNFEECKDFVANQFVAIGDFARTNSGSGGEAPDKETMDKVMELMAPTFANHEVFLSTYCPDLALLFSGFGAKFKVDSVIVEETELMNPFGGRPFPSTQTITATIDKDFFATIAVSQTLKPKETKEIMYETFKFIAESSKEPFKEDDIPLMEMNSKTSYLYDLNARVLLMASLAKSSSAEIQGVRKYQDQSILVKMTDPFN